jgi:hypothetical protein
MFKFYNHNHMRLILFLLLIVFVFSAWSSELELLVENERVLLSGSCLNVKDQLKQLTGLNTPDCNERQSTHSIDILPHLPKRIGQSLTLKEPNFNGPNCWNSVLYAKNMHQGLHFSANEVEFWLSTPLCESVVGMPKNGDILNINEITDAGAIMEYHSFLALTDKIAFNKKSDLKTDPYEIVFIEDYLDKSNIDSDCRFMGFSKSSSKCPFVVNSFRCKKFDSILDNLPKEHQQQMKVFLKEASEDIQNALFFNTYANLQVLEKELDKTINDSLSAIGMKDKIPDSLVMAFDKYARTVYEPVLANSSGIFRPGEDMAVKFFILASPGFYPRASAISYKEILLEAKRTGYFSTLNTDELLAWSQVYLTAFSLKQQIQLVSRPDK